MQSPQVDPGTLLHPERFHQLLRAGESLTTELKTTADDRELVAAAVCLANGSGGVLVVGATDDGRAVGARPRHGDHTDPGLVRSLIASRTEPPLEVDAQTVVVDDQELLVVEVPRTDEVVGTKTGHYTRRALDVHGRPECIPMRAHELVSRAGALGQHDYSLVALPDLGLGDLDPTELDRFRGLARQGGDEVTADLSDRDLLRALQLTTLDDRLTVGAVLLFGLEETIARAVPTHEVAFQVLERLEVRVNRLAAWPLLRAMVEIERLLEPYNPEEEIQVGLFRVGLPRYAPEAIRELVANALVHRDYTLRQAVNVKVEDDELRIVSPGGFPAGITIENLLVAPPRPRNPGLADAFKRAGLVERTGRGVNRVYLRQLEVGRPAPDYGRTTDAWVEARLRSGPADRELAAFVVESRQHGEQLSLDDLLILHEVRAERRISSGRAGELLQIPADEARAKLNGLVERGLLESRGERKGRTYHLASGVYRRMGDPSGYVRTRGFEPIQQEQMVQTYVETHGSISRSEAADLCHLSPPQASSLLRRMRDEGKLEMRGQRRGARYVLPEP